MQSVAEFVKQRDHLVVRQQRGLRAPTGAVKLHTSCATGSAVPDGSALATTHSSIQAPLRFSVRE